jgi:hypothetical protein
MRQELAEGLAAGALCALILGLVALRPGSRERRAPLPAAGLATALSTLVAIALHRDIPLAALLGVAGVALSVEVADLRSWPRAVSALLAVPFAALLGRDASDVGWVIALVALAGPLGVLVAQTERQWNRAAITPALFAVSALGVYACVPDTEEAAALLGAAVALATVGWPLRLVTLGPSGAAAAIAVLAWVAAVGGRGRPAATIGALACVGLLAGLAAGAALAGRAAPALRRWPLAARAVAVLAAQVGVAALASRWAGLQTDPVEAAALATFAVVLSLLLGGLISPPRPARMPRPLI